MRQTASSRKKNRNNTERNIIQNNYIICKTKWKIIYTKPFYGKQQPHTHNYKCQGQTRKKLTLMNRKKKWKTGQKLVMNNNILDIRRHGGRSSPTPTSNNRMEATTTAALEKGLPRTRETPSPRPPGHPAR